MITIRNILFVAAITMAAPAAMAGYASVSSPISERVEKLELMMGAQSSGNINDQIAQLQQEVATLRGELEAANHQIEKLSARQQDLYSDLDSRLLELRPSHKSK